MRIGFVLPLLLLGAVGTALTALAQPAGTFTSTGGMGVPRVGHTATLLLNGKVLICGGKSQYDSLGTVSASAELYDPAARTFSATRAMTTPRYSHTATLLSDGKVLVAGGAADANGRSMLSSAELYDPATATFTATADMTTARAGHTATLLSDGKLLIAGGLSMPSRIVNPIINILATSELYDPNTETFSPTGKMVTNRSGHTASLLPNGKVLLAGGGGYEDGVIPEVELYDPATGAFSLAGATGSVQSVGPAIASVLTSGQVLMPLHLYDSPTPAARLYDATNQVFTDTGNMRAPRLSSATLLPNRKVLIAGYAAGNGYGFPPPGWPNSNGLPSADLYDPGIGAFSATGDMTTPRFNHTATLLPDGTVLISGGMTSFLYPDNALASAEIYRPDVLVPAPVLDSLSGGGRGPGAILHAGTHQLVSPTDPAIAGEALEIYGAGLDDQSVIPPQVAIGGKMAEVLYFGEAPGYTGLNQINVRVPSGVAPSPAVSVRLNYIGRPSNEVTISVQ
jgi:hypothetical protein